MIEWIEIEAIAIRIEKIVNMGVAIQEAIEYSPVYGYEELKESLILMNELMFEQQKKLESIVDLELKKRGVKNG